MCMWQDDPDGVMNFAESIVAWARVQGVVPADGEVAPDFNRVCGAFTLTRVHALAAAVAAATSHGPQPESVLSKFPDQMKVRVLNRQRCHASTCTSIACRQYAHPLFKRACSHGRRRPVPHGMAK